METRTAPPIPQRIRLARLILLYCGLLCLFSRLLVNPWLGRYYRQEIVGFSDVMLGYFCWSAGLGLLLLFLSRLLSGTSSETAVGFSLALSTVTSCSSPTACCWPRSDCRTGFPTPRSTTGSVPAPCAPGGTIRASGEK